MPTLPPIATPTDMADYGFDPVDEAILDRASTRVRRAAGRQQITPGTSTVTLRGSGPWRLPQRPVTDLVSVTDADGGTVDAELRGPYLHACTCGPLTVEYSHGFDPLPDELVELVCSIASRLAAIPAAMAAGVRTEQAGGESVTWGADGWQGTTGLTSPELAALRAIYPRLPRTAIIL